MRGRRRTARTPKSALFWRLFGFNALVFLAAAAVLLLSPATVSTHASLAEIGVVAVGSALMLVANALLLRTSLRAAGRAHRADGAGRPAAPRRAAVRPRRPATSRSWSARSTTCSTGWRPSAAPAARTRWPPRRRSGNASPGNCTTRSDRA